MNNIMRAVREPSSWAGLAAILEGIKFVMPAHAAVIVAVQAALGAVAVALREAGPAPAPTAAAPDQQATPAAAPTAGDSGPGGWGGA